MAIDLADDDGGLNGEILAEVIADELLVRVAVHDADIGVRHLAKVLAALFGERFSHSNASPYKSAAADERRQFLLRRHIALWDVVLSCEIQGSADASIREEEVADVAGLIEGSKIRAVFCNGKLAYRLLTERAAPLAVPVMCLPSTSPANPRFDAAVWQDALQGVFGEQV